MPAILDAVRAYATLGEVITAMEGVFGVWVEDPAV
jgi:methylmalonyl-CoA mutase N-terminal domain/subunit